MDSSKDLMFLRQACLARMQPLCMTLMKERTVNNVNAILKSLPHIDTEVSREIQVYLLFPIKTCLAMKDLSDSMFLALCLTVEAIYTKNTKADSSEAYDIIGLVLLSAAPLNQPNTVQAMSEDSKMALCKAVSAVLSALKLADLQQLYTLKHTPALGQLISVLLHMAERERAKAAQLAALHTLHTLYCCGGPIENVTTSEAFIGSALAFCLPAVTMAATRIITGDPKQGHKVFAQAADLWTRAVLCSVNNEVFRRATGEYGKSQQQIRNKQATVGYEGLATVQDMAWMQVTREKLKILMDKLLGCRAHNHYLARLALARLAHTLLIHCNQSLPSLVSPAVDLLVGYLADSHPRVAQQTSTLLQQYASTLTDHSQKHGLVETLQGGLYSLCTSLPRQMRMADEEDKPAVIRLLKGYLMLLGQDVRSVFLSHAHLKRVCLALVCSLELDTADIHILEERNTLLPQDAALFTTDTSPGLVWRRRTTFKHIHDPEVIKELMEVCRLLGRHGDLAVLVDHLLCLWHESSVYQLAASLVVNEMVQGAGEFDSSEDILLKSSKQPTDVHALNDVIRLILDEYLSPENLQILDILDSKPPSPSPSSSSSSSFSPLHPTHQSSHQSLYLLDPSPSLESGKIIAERSKAVLQTCLFMEGIGCAAQALGPMFQDHLITALYPLVECLGHENMEVSSAAWCALGQVCQACGYRSLDELLQANADYLVSSVSLKLRHLTHHRRCPTTLRVMMGHCSASLLPLVEHSVVQLLDSLDQHYSDSLLLFLPVLMEMAVAVGRWFPSNHIGHHENHKDPHGNHGDEDLVAFVQEYARLRRTGDMEEEPDQGKEDRSMEDIEGDMGRLLEEQKREKDKLEEEESEEEDKEEKEKECPRHIQVVQEILLRVKHFLSSPDGRVCIKSLDIVSQCITDLRGHEKELLPQLHQLWPSFSPLFRSQHKFVVIKAVSVLRLISEAGGDFVRQRTVKGVMPGLVGFMDKQGKMSSGSRSAYTLTGNYKLQLAILNNIGTIATNFSLDSSDLECVASMCVPYLCNKQPKLLQEASIASVTQLISLDPSALWMTLLTIYCPALPPPPGPEFVPIKTSLSQGQNNSYTDNVQHLLDLFYKCPLFKSL